MEDQNKKLQAQAKNWVKENRKKLITKFCDEKLYPRVDDPVTIFMAGTPGAGKTELSVNLAKEFGGGFVRIDADDIREMMRPLGYNGQNSDIFQSAVTKAVNQLFDFANRKGGQNVILDGTFAYGDWRVNVERSIAHARTVEIYYLYQDPIRAWEYVSIRAAKQGGRHVPVDVFLDSYQLSIENVKKAKEVFKDKVTIYFAQNDYQKNIEKIVVDVDDIDKYLPKMYNVVELKKLLHERTNTKPQS